LTYSSCGQEKRLEPLMAVQLLPALAKFSVGLVMVTRNAIGMIFRA
jgi:hypothetical protein